MTKVWKSEAIKNKLRNIFNFFMQYELFLFCFFILTIKFISVFILIWLLFLFTIIKIYLLSSLHFGDVIIMYIRKRGYFIINILKEISTFH